MNQNKDTVESFDDDAMTLDPPGSIAVVGAGPLGIEAALYGRVLGYDVTLIEAISIASSLRGRGGDPLPMLPDRSLSPLAVSALGAQSTESTLILPMTFDQWIDGSLQSLSQSDLLAGRLRCPTRVTRIENVPVQADEPEEDTSDIPSDFRLSLQDAYGQTETLDFESVILATGDNNGIELGFELPTDYFFSIGQSAEPLSEQSLKQGYAEVVAIYAQLAGRSTLDLYRPRRGGA